MEDLQALLRGLARGSTIDDLWRECGFESIEAAAAALDGLAASRPRTRRGTAKRPPASRPAVSIPAGGAADLVIRTDGASRGNPGPAAVAAIAFLPSGERLADASRAIGNATNNVAEYTAVLDGLELARSIGGRRLSFLLDSELVVRQLRGEYRIRNEALRALAERALGEAAGFERCTWAHVPRKENAEADALANEALDRAQEKAGERRKA